MTQEQHVPGPEQIAPGIVARAESLAKDVNELASEVDSINVLNPMSISTLNQIDKKRESLRPRVKELLGAALGTMRTPQSGPGFALGAIQTLSLGESLAAILLIQNQWQRLVGTIDRKSAFTVAVLSIYISVASMVITVCFGIATLP
jgi:hypothetical protein